MESGSFRRTLGGKTYKFDQSSILVFWGAYPHRLLEVAPPGRCLILYIPLRHFLSWDLDRSFVQRILKGDLAVIPQKRELREVIKLLKTRILDGRLNNPTRATEKEVQSQFFRLAESALANPNTWKHQGKSIGPSIDQISRMMYFLIENFQAPVKLVDLCRVTGLHPNYAWALFRKATGKTVMQYLTEYRIAYAQELLINTEKKIIDIALDSGFGSVSQFYAVFKSVCAVTPTAYRRAKNGEPAR